MLEINLVPGATRRSSRRRLPRLGGGGLSLKLPKADRAKLLMVGSVVLAAALIAFLHISTSARLDELRTEQQAAQRDSARFAQMKAQGDSLRQQETVISQKLAVIQEIDAGRYVWGHILDESSRALPPYVWLVNLTDAASDGEYPRVRIEGRAGNYFALGRYIQQLNQSPFLRDVRLLSSSQTRADERTVYAFILELAYEEPPPDVIQTVPLFAATQQED